MTGVVSVTWQAGDQFLDAIRHPHWWKNLERLHVRVRQRPFLERVEAQWLARQCLELVRRAERLLALALTFDAGADVQWMADVERRIAVAARHERPQFWVRCDSLRWLQSRDANVHYQELVDPANHTAVDHLELWRI